MKNIFVLCALIIGLNYTNSALPMDNYCMVNGIAQQDCGVLETQIITLGLAATVFAGTTWFFCNNCHNRKYFGSSQYLVTSEQINQYITKNELRCKIRKLDRKRRRNYKK